jgi:DNA-directed RNA polymerase subunit RPC12/RpoP
MFCTRCGNQAEKSGALFCPFCGGKFVVLQPSAPKPSNVENPVRGSGDSLKKREEVVFVPARCTASKEPFVIRFERRGINEWHAESAAAVDERRLRNPSFQDSQISGSLKIGAEYRCPHCRAGSIWVDSSCGDKISCWNGNQRSVVCPWCGTSAWLEKRKIAKLKGLADG